MAEIILKTNQLTKSYKHQHALDNVTVTVRRGMIYGLIGENGAGKSTFMRAVMGLIHPTSGELSLFGGHTRKELLDARRKIGQSIETPALYLDLTGKQNMQIQVAYGGVSERQIEELLALVNLNSAEKKKVKNYSLGMKQRLAIAMALVTNPELLILDEPMNGLDPLGIVEVRELLKKLVTEKGLTVILSSHLLSELSEIATHYGIIHNGKLIKEMSKEQLETETKKYITLCVDNPEQAIVVFNQLAIQNYRLVDTGTFRIFDHNEQISQINKALVQQDIAVTKIDVVNQTLENYFMDLIGGAQ